MTAVEIEQENKFLNRLINESTAIDHSQYERYSVKRGLRNADGTGVVVGLTEIGDVHGYILDEGDKIPREGRLRYRGVNLFDLVSGFQAEKRYGFEETAFLLLFGKLPNEEELAEFNELLGRYRTLPETFTEDIILKAPSSNIMNKLSRSVLSLYSFDENADDISVENILHQSLMLIARLPVLASYAFHAKRHNYDNGSLYIHPPKAELSTAENILRLLRPGKDYSPLEAELLDLSLVMHAEHGGGNNSSFTMHVVSSSGTDTYAAVAAAIGSLKGPLHGGANAKVCAMIQDAKDSIENWDSEEEVTVYVQKLLEKKAFDKSGLVYGMGHAVYTLSDPRAVILKKKAEELAKEKGFEKEFMLHNLIETLTPKLFSEFKGREIPICANVDFYSGFVYSMLEIPEEMYTPLFAISRITGWCAHRIEELVSGGRIIRPAYRSVAGKRDYIPVNQR